MNNCPICNNESELIKTINCGNFDQSLLYGTVKIKCCKNCGHIFNELTEDDIKYLNLYYITEYSEFHNLIYKTEKIDNDSDTLNIHQKNLNHYLSSLKQINTKKTLGIEKKYKTIILDQFIEHVVNLKDLILNVSEHLEDNGTLIISFPNTYSFLNKKHFPNYPFLIREHIQHFDSFHLICLLSLFDFRLTKFSYNEIEILKNTFMPNVTLTFKKGGVLVYGDGNDFFSLRDKIKSISDYFEVHLKEPCYCYGIGREFLFLYENELINNIEGLIDNTPSKRNYTVDNMRISNDDILLTLPNDSNIFITAFAHKKAITEKLAKVFKGYII